MNFAASNLVANILLIFCLLVHPSRCETIQRWDDDDWHFQAPLPWKETKVGSARESTRAPFPWTKTVTSLPRKTTRAPCERTKAPFLRVTTRPIFPWERAKAPFLRKTTRPPFPWKNTKAPFLRETTRPPFPRERTKAPFLRETTKAPFPSERTKAPFFRETTSTPFPWERSRSPFPWDTTSVKIRTLFPRKISRTPFTTPPLLWNRTWPTFPWTRDPFPWERTYDPFPWERTDNPFPWERTNDPFPWERTNDPFPWERTNNPFPYETTSENPFPWTIPPFLRNLTMFPWVKTEDPFDWKITRPPWDRFTLPRYDYRYNNSSSNGTAVIIMIVFGVAILMAVTFSIKYFVCRSNDCCGNDSTDIYAPVLHPPPRSSATATSNRTQYTPTIHTSNRSQFATPPIHTVREDIFANRTDTEPFGSIDIPTRNYASSGINIRSTNEAGISPSDKPPDYTTVVSDLATKFPEVQPTNVPDSPPPSYSEKIFHM